MSVFVTWFHLTVPGDFLKLFIEKKTKKRGSRNFSFDDRGQKQSFIQPVCLSQHTRERFGRFCSVLFQETQSLCLQLFLCCAAFLTKRKRQVPCFCLEIFVLVPGFRLCKIGGVFFFSADFYAKSGSFDLFSNNFSWTFCPRWSSYVHVRGANPFQRKETGIVGWVHILTHTHISVKMKYTGSAERLLRHTDMAKPDKTNWTCLTNSRTRKNNNTRRGYRLLLSPQRWWKLF